MTRYVKPGFILASLLWGFSVVASADNTVRITVHADQPGAPISRHFYGQFAEHLGRGIYEGVWIGKDSPIANVNGFRTDVIEALRKLHIPNIRWPGGCFADAYHWRDGIGPAGQRWIQ